MTKRTNKRAISTIIGSAIFLVLFVAGFTVFIFALEVSSERFSEQLSASFEQTIRGKEQFTIAPSINLADTLFIEVVNTGSVPLNIIRAYVVDMSDGTLLEYEINFADAHVAPNESRAILENYVQGSGSAKTNIPDGIYDVKVVSELGTVAIKILTVPLDPFFVDLFTIPKAIGSGQDVTIAMLVYNRGNATLFDVAPVTAATTMTVPNTSISGTTIGPNPSSINALEPQESVLFTWEQTVIGAVGTSIVYTNSATGTDDASGDTVTSGTDSSSVKFVPQAISLVQRPQIAFTIPNPAGETNGERAVWGMNILNPTDTPIEVSRIVLNAIPSTTVQIFKVGDICANTEIDPLTSNGSFTCPAANVLAWSDLDKITVPARDIQEFFVLVDTIVPGGTTDPMTLVGGTVFSSFGPATEITISTSSILKSDGGAAYNILATTATSGLIVSDAIVTSVIQPNLKDVCSGSTFNLNVAIVAISNEIDSQVESGTLVINIPPGFKVGTIVDVNNEFSAALDTPTEFSDGSNQITGDFTLLGDDDTTPGGSASPEAFYVQIPLTAPIVTVDALYIVFALADGITTHASEHPIAPLMQFPIQVLEVGC